jgi:hypothetical protein
MTRQLFGLLALLAVSLGAVTSAAAADPAPPALTADAPTFDAGRVEAGTKVTHTYVLSNAGSAPLPILVKASCGCTATEYDRVIPAGGTGTVTAVLDTTRMRGKVRKSIDVLSTDARTRLLTLTIGAEPVRALVVKPNDQPTLRGAIGALRPVELTITAPDGAAFEITKVESDATILTRVAPLDPATTPSRGHRLTLTPKPDLAVGTYHATVTLVTTLPSAARFSMPVMVVIAGPLVTVPAHLRVRPDREPLAFRVTPASTATPSFTVLRAEVGDPDFRAEYARVEGEPAWDVTVRYEGAPTRHGQVNTIVKLATDVPSQPFVFVRISGKL